MFPHFTVARNVGLVPRLEGWAEETIEARVDELLERWASISARDSRSAIRVSFPEASGNGWAWRARWRPIPPMLLFDEPFGALDPVTRRELQKQFLGSPAISTRPPFSSRTTCGRR